jgi:hypothetical protein
MTTAVHEIPEEAYAPRDAEHRYRVYARRGRDLRILAFADSPGGVGVALVQLDEDEREHGRRLVDLGAIGVLDAVEGRWIVLPWHRPERP